VIQVILLYALWFSFGLLAGSFLMYYVMRKDIDDSHKQFEKDKKNKIRQTINEQYSPN